jgi:iron complex outermembrane receptor protein
MFLGFCITAQTVDSTSLISEVVIDGYRKPANLMTATQSVAVTSNHLLRQNAPDRLVESLNLLSGVKMEERSPGSYRISIRGSTLRSPFGIRNVKIYLDDFVLSDASGNSYLNLLDPELFRSIEVYKGPEGGDFGSATGGTVLLKTSSPSIAEFGVSAGSFNNFKGKVNYSGRGEKSFFRVFSSYQLTDSYREQSALERKFFFLNAGRNYSENNEVKGMLIYSDLAYQTPGGLTFDQMMQDPRQARPKTQAVGGAKEQQAAIYNKTVMAGLSNVLQFDEKLSHFIAVHGSYTDFRNPFITTYEKRFEVGAGVRTHFNFENNFENIFSQSRIGFEGATGQAVIRNFDNNAGQPAGPQNFDNIFTRSGFFFLSQKAVFKQKLFIDASLSLNLMKYEWESLFPNAENGVKKFNNELLPNFGVSYAISSGLSIRGKLSKGNSAPTTEEIRSSAQQINTDLFAESGWNKEVGLRKQWGKFLYTELNIFDFRLKNAIVRRENASAQEFFVNAGETVQKGIEFTLETGKLNLNNSVLNGLKLYFSGNLFDFKFKNYQKNETDYSGNELTGVPATSVQGIVSFDILKIIKADITHFYTSKMPLNDANTVFFEAALVGNIGLGMPIAAEKFDIHVSARVQNIYNSLYSLGYDINAFGNRYYNPAATRNYLLGITFKIK